MRPTQIGALTSALQAVAVGLLDDRPQALRRGRGANEQC